MNGAGPVVAACAHDVNPRYPAAPDEPTGTVVLLLSQAASDVNVAINGILVVDYDARQLNRHTLFLTLGLSGAGLVVLLGAIVLTGCMGVGVQRVGSAAAARARVDGVADLTALAAVSGGSGAGGQVALAAGRRQPRRIQL